MEGKRENTGIVRGKGWDVDTRIHYLLDPLLNLGRTDGGNEIESGIISRRQECS